METQTIINILKKLIQFGSFIIFVLTLISFFGRYPFLELTTHFRFQYLWLSAIFLILLCVFRSWSFAIPTLLVLGSNALYVFPYLYPAQDVRQNSAKKSLRVMLANVEHRNKNYERLLESVKTANPDIVVLQEVTEVWRENIKNLETDYQYVKSMPKQGGSGMAIFSRYPLESSEILQLDESTHPALLNKINIDSKTLTLLSIHPPTPIRSDKFINRNKQFAESARILRETTNPKIMIGDMNNTMWSPYFIALVRDSGLQDVRIGRGIYPSWISFFPSLFRIPIDHCLVSEDIEIESVSLGNSTGSDHLPLIIDLKISL